MKSRKFEFPPFCKFHFENKIFPPTSDHLSPLLLKLQAPAVSVPAAVASTVGLGVSDRQVIGKLLVQSGFPAPYVILQNFGNAASSHAGLHWSGSMKVNSGVVPQHFEVAMLCHTCPWKLLAFAAETEEISRAASIVLIMAAGRIFANFFVQSSQ